jgi:hypothetical protein
VKRSLAIPAVFLVIALVAIAISGCAGPATGGNASATGSPSGTVQAAGGSPSPTAKPTGPAPTAQATAAPEFAGWPSTGNDSVDLFTGAVLAPFSQGNKTPVVRRWWYDTRVDIFLAGQPTAEDRQAIEACIDEINGLRSDYGDVYLDIEDSESMANVIIYSGPADQFPHYLAFYDPYKYSSNGIRPSAGEYDLQTGGYKIWYDYTTVPALDRGTTHAVIVLPDSGLSQAQRSFLLWRDIAAILGAHGSAPKYPGSIFGRSPGDAGYSAEDKAVLALLLPGHDIGPGMTYDMVVQVLVHDKSWSEAVNLDSHASTFR